ncbi:[protein-PII] uridylyltransferase [Thermovibrio ammonificans]
MSLEKAKERFFKEIERAKELHTRKETGFEVAQQLKKALDQLLKPAFKEFFGRWEIPAALLALGGYGRGELNFHSDIDVNLIYDGHLTESHREDVEAFYYFLLSLKKDLGFAPRSIKEALELAQSDLSIFTNLLQRRFLAGSREVERSFTKQFNRFVKENREALVNEIQAARSERYRRFYGTVYYQEPNVKESKGGLRDLHEAFWVAKIVFGIEGYSGFLDRKILDRKNFREVISAYDFMLQVRNQLHLLSGRRSDILSFEMQPQVAKHFGFPEKRKGVELFMKSYFNAAIDLSVITKEVIKAAKEELSRKKKSFSLKSLLGTREEIGEFFVENNSLFVKEEFESVLLKEPELVLKGFKIVQEKGVELSASAFSLFKLAAESNRERFREERVLGLFREILTRRERLSYTLELMHDTKVLGALIPDFERLRGHFQYDTYHKFTTDIHSILTVRELEKLAEKGTAGTPVKEKQQLSQILQDLDSPHLLFIAALFHDIGKGKPGRHEFVGASLTRRYMEEMGFSEQETEEVCWLVRNHLLMSHVAFRRDISDPKLVEQFKNECQTEERLKKLFLLTYADIKAVGPGAWDNWKSSLLWRLYRGALALFQADKGIEQLILQKLQRRKEKVKELLKGKIRPESVERFFENADRDYLITYSSEEIAKHMLLMKEIKREGLEYKTYHESFPDIGYTKIVIVTKYRRGLFNKVAGIFSYLGINIKGANINKAIEDDCECMVYTIQVSTVAGEALPCEKVEEFEQVLKAFYEGKFKVEELGELLKPKTFRRSVPLPETKVKVDNETSDKYTIVEVSTHDRLGVLYTITKVLLEEQTRLRRAIITTEGNRVIDSFYITDMDYKKVTDPQKLLQIKERIVEALSPKP